MNQNLFNNVGESFDYIFSNFANRPAIYCQDKKKDIPYFTLKKKVDQIIQIFLNNELNEGDVCIIFNDKSIIGFASIIACIYLGIVFVNLDQNSPKDRLEKIFKKCKPKFLINLSCDKKVINKLKSKFKILNLKNLEENNKDIKNISFKSKPNKNTPLYVMFTSGSTGFPKGAIISHGNLLNFVSWAKIRFNINEFDRFTNINPIYFDNSIFDFFVSFLNGSCLVPITEKLISNPLNVLKLISESKCTIWFSVPSFLIYLLRLRILDIKYFHSIRTIIFGGEGFPKKHLKVIYETFKKEIILENVYGPTECTCICSSHRITEADFSNMKDFATLGKLAPSFSYYIKPIDHKNLKKGELILFGPSVGCGYINDEKITSKSFLKFSTDNHLNKIGYKTGDIVKVDDEGYFFFISRKDHQIKNMGYRIELGEIEAVANNLNGIYEAAAIYKELEDGIGIIKLFLASELIIGESKIRKDLESKLPKYMLPKIIKLVKELPKNANGKIDRKFLN